MGITAPPEGFWWDQQPATLATAHGHHPTCDEFDHLADMAEPLLSKYEDSCFPEWEASRLAGIRTVSSSLKRGKIGEELVIAWARSVDLDVRPRSTRGHDCVIEDVRIEVKTSLRWNNGRYVFLGLKDFDYDAVALLGLAPAKFGLWIVPKHLLLQRAQDQLRGAEGRGSKWISFQSGNPPDWISRWGGSFAKARTALTELPAYAAEIQAQLTLRDTWAKASAGIDWPWDSHDPPTRSDLPPAELNDPAPQAHDPTTHADPTTQADHPPSYAHCWTTPSAWRPLPPAWRQGPDR